MAIFSWKHMLLTVLTISACKLLSEADGFFITGRTVSERETECATRTELQDAWNNRDTSYTFTKLFANRAVLQERTTVATITSSGVNVYTNGCARHVQTSSSIFLGEATYELKLDTGCNVGDSRYHWRLKNLGGGKFGVQNVNSGACMFSFGDGVGNWRYHAGPTSSSSSQCPNSATHPICNWAIGCDSSYLQNSHLLKVVPVRCGCGQEANILSSAANVQTLYFTCEDWDECREDHGCPQHSTCVNTVGSYECHCDLGYHVQDDPLTRIGTYQDTCELDGFDVEVVQRSFNSIAVRSVGAPPQVVDFRVTRQVWEDSDTLVTPSRNAVKVRSRAISEVGVLFDTLESGVEMQFVFQPLDVDGNDIPSAPSSVRATTSCSCNSGDGRPEDLVIEQEDGFVIFSFVDASTCDEAFAFTRRLPTSSNNSAVEGDVFTPNYYYFASSSSLCQPVPFKPGKQASDDLRVSKLEVGEEFEYCVRGIAPRSDYTTEYTCDVHRIRWEASVAGTVSLEPNAGGLAVEGVNVTYTLYNSNNEPVRGGSLTTGVSGNFDIVFNEDLPGFTQNGRYRLHLEFSKTTSGVQHEFLCNQGELDCTTAGVDLYLKHLKFEQEVKVVDDTSLPFSGHIYVAGTAFGSEPGCPVVNAEVCLLDFTSRNSKVNTVCTTTSNTGFYTLPAVIGLRVSVNVDYFNHTMEPLDPAKANDLANGVVIQANGVYEDNDWLDMQTTGLTTEVAGGLCNRVLGTSSIRVRIANCPEWDGMLLPQDDYTEEHVVPAHDLSVNVDGIAGNLGAEDSLKVIVKQIDLTSVEEGQEAVDLPEDAQAEVASRSLLRFQYNGTMAVRVTITREETTNCPAPTVPGSTSTSFHVVPLRPRVDIATFYLQQEFGNGIESCDHLADDTSVTLTNSLGLVAASLADRTYREELAKVLDSTNLALMESCNTGCNNVVITHDVILNVTRNARIVFAFRFSRPNKFTPHTKFISISRNAGLESFLHTAAVVVTGDFDNGELDSVALPTYKPFLVVRDPPGGLSYAYYENVKTTFRLNYQEGRTYVGPEHNVKIKTIANEEELDGCVGGGIGAIALVCQHVLEAESAFSVNWDGQTEVLASLTHAENGGEYTTTWTYETSIDVWLAGEQSDAFAVPNLNVIFRTVDVISFDIPTCTASSTIDTVFNLDSPKNEPAIAWYTRYTIENEELPALLRLSQEFGTKLATESDPAEITKLTNNKEAVDDAYKAWLEALGDYNTTNVLIQDNKLDGVAPHQWFDNFAAGVDKGENEPDQPTTWSSLVPEALAQRAEARTVPWSSIQRTGSEDELESSHLIKFDGGASLFKFELKHEKYEEHLKQMGGFGANVDQENDVYVTGEGKLSSKAGIGTEVLSGLRITTHHEFTQTDKEGDTTKVGFVLGDEDAGDLFDVQVHFDPKYGTFVFNTVAGKTRCPHEANTDVREAPKIEFTSPVGPVLPDEDMVFHLRLTNEGEDFSAFQLTVDHRTNPGDLVHLVNGDTLAVPQQYDRIESGETVHTTLVLKRGPELFGYPPLELQFRSACEYTRNIGDGNLIALGDKVASVVSLLSNDNGRIVFTEPCPKISWAGDIEDEQRFISNVVSNTESIPVIIQNEGAYDFATSVTERRLQRVELLFRRKNELAWNVARARPRGAVDFDVADFAAVGVEDAFGFALLEWSVPVFDGEYEIAARTVCQPTGEDEIDSFITQTISGRVDRIPPESYGLPSPAFRELLSSDEFKFRFTEPIDCRKPYPFRFSVTINGLNTTYDTKELRVICNSEAGTIAFMLPTRLESDIILGKTINIELENVLDLAGNSIAEAVKHQGTYASFNASSDLSFFNLQINIPCDPVNFDENAVADSLVEELALLLAVNASRIQVQGAVCVGPNLVSANVQIWPESQHSSALRRRLQDSAASSLDLYTELKNLLASGGLLPGEYALLANTVLDPSTFQVLDSASGLSAGAETSSGSTPVVYINGPDNTEELQTLVSASAMETRAQLSEVQGEMQTLMYAVVALGLMFALALVGLSWQLIKVKSTNTAAKEGAEPGALQDLYAGDQLHSTNPLYARESIHSDGEQAI